MALPPLGVHVGDVKPHVESSCNCCDQVTCCWPFGRSKEIKVHEVPIVVPPTPRQPRRSLDLVEAHVTEIWQVNYGNDWERSTTRPPERTKSEDEV